MENKQKINTSTLKKNSFEEDKIIKENEEINLDEFQNSFNEITTDKSNLKNVFLEGFAFIDREK